MSKKNAIKSYRIYKIHRKLIISNFWKQRQYILVYYSVNFTYYQCNIQITKTTKEEMNHVKHKFF